MTPPIHGLHHVTAIASDPQANLDFYAGVLGLRLVKQTVNFDDPHTYHFYFGNRLGEPGTILTFFPWPNARRGTRGAGQTTLTAFSVPEGSLGSWQERLRSHGVDCDAPRATGDEERLRLRDPDGLLLELVAHEGAADLEPITGSPVAETDSIRGLYGVTLSEADVERSSRFLLDTLGFQHQEDLPAGERIRLGDSIGRYLDVVGTGPERGRIAAGTVHHIAFRVSGDAEELAWQDELVARGVQVSPVMDRNYFHSIYFREPGGILFEIATDPPGFAIDEGEDELGCNLELPAQYERERKTIEAVLPKIELPQKSVAS